MSGPKTFNLRLYEVEHHGDLDTCIQDLGASGAEILAQQLDEEAEEAVVRVRVSDFTDFCSRFEQTPSADFCDSLGWLESCDA